jgi:5'-3' exonuclease
MKADTVLIDGKNCIYRAVYAGYNDPRHKKEQRDYFIILSRFLHKYLTTFEPRSFHVFWDEDSHRIWRCRILPTYKVGRDRESEIDVEVDRLTKISKEMFSHMGIRQYERKKMEADDLLYTFCKLDKSQTIIVSSDGDIMQIPYHYDNVRVHNPLRPKFTLEPRPENNPAEMRALMGDASDKIDGYYRIGPKKAAVMLEDKKKLNDFLSKVDDKVFKMNMALIDLSLCPYLLSNIRYTIKVMAEDIQFNEKELFNIAQKYKVHGFMGEYKRNIYPFRTLVNNV